VGETVVGAYFDGPEVGGRAHGIDPFTQLLRCFVREGDAEGRVDPAGIEKMGQPQRHGRGFAGPRSGIHS
jgi:hypothetical protein